MRLQRLCPALRKSLHKAADEVTSAPDWPSFRPLGWLRIARAIAVAVGGFLLLLLPHLLWRLSRGAAPSPLALLYVRMVAWSMGLQITVRGEGFEKRALIVANHISWTDIVAIAASVPTSFVARADVRHWPGMGQLAKLGATIFVDRASRRSTPSQVSAISSALRSGRVVLFPEGTTGNGSGLLPFRSTLFDGASGAPVQPVAIRYCDRNGNQWDSNQLAAFAWDGDKTFLPHLGAVIASGGAKAELIVLPPLPPGRGDRKKRANEAHALIKAALRYAS